MVKRTEYRDPDFPDSIRDGPTTYAESLADVERYFVPMGRLRTSALHGWGVADGLRVTATPGASAVSVGTGTALDAAGNQIVLTDGGAAVVDQHVLGDVIRNVPTVRVGAEGVTIDTTSLNGEYLVTIIWREVLGENDWVNAPALVHAPWLLLVPPAGFSDVGEKVVLAHLTVGADGKVADGGLTVGPRRSAGVPAGRLQLRMPRAVADGASPLAVEQSPVAELTADASGDVVLTLLAGAQVRTALTVEQATGRTTIAGGLAVDGDARFGGRVAAADLAATTISGASLSVSGAVNSGDVTAGNISSASLSVSGTFTAGDVTAGGLSGETLRIAGEAITGDLTATSLEVSAGILTGGTVETAGFQTDGAAWLRGQVYTGGVFGHWDGSADLKLFNSDIWDGGDGWLQLRSGGGKTFLHGDVTVEGQSWLRGQVSVEGPSWLRGQVSVEGQSWLRGQVYTGGVFGHWDGSATLKLFGSNIYDVGDGWLQLQSGAGRTYMRGEVWVEGALHKAGGGFKIDHPTQPEDKYLSHSFVESPDMVNLYAGTVVTDDDGVATVDLPDYFEALNSDHRFQLTTVGRLALATVEGGVRENAFTIRTDQPGVTVSWQVTGIRQDPWAEANRIPVVEEKPEEERGLFMHPALYGQPDDRAVLRTPASSVAPEAQPDAELSSVLPVEPFPGPDQAPTSTPPPYADPESGRP